MEQKEKEKEVEEKTEGTLLCSTATPAVLRWVLIGATWLHCRVVVSNLGRSKSSATVSFPSEPAAQRTPHPAPHTQHTAPHTPHPAPRTPHPAGPRTPHPTLRPRMAQKMRDVTETRHLGTQIHHGIQP